MRKSLPMLRIVNRGKPAVEVVAKNIRCKSLETRAELQQALAEGWESFCAVLPSGYAKFWLKDPKWLDFENNASLAWK